MVISWGPELRMLYNDGYATILGNKHPAALGQPAAEVWSEIWPTFGAVLSGVVEGCGATGSEDQLVVLARNGFAEETYFTWSYSALADDNDKVLGIFTTTTETTARALHDRRQATLVELGAQVADATRLTVACDAAVRTLGENTRDVAFALLYLLDADGRSARLCASHGLAPGSAATPTHVALDGEDLWSLAAAVSTRSEVVIDDVEARFGRLVCGEWPEPVQRAMVLPLATNSADRPLGVIVVGTSPRLALDGPYRDFLRLANNHVASALTSAKTREEERRHAEALADIDHIRTAQSRVEPAFAPPPKRISGSARILIADDNVEMREYVARVLGGHWNVEIATDGASALAAVRANKPDLVVADIMMPRLDGFALLKEIRADATTSKLPVVFLSARAADDARLVGLEAGAADYLVKPFAARELVARVALHLELASLRSDADAIQRISSTLTAELDLDKLLQLITDEATKLVGAQFGAFFYNVVNEKHESYTLYTLSGVPREAFSKFPMPRNTHVFGPTFRGERVVRIDDVKKDPRYGKNPPYNGMPAGHLPVCSYLAAPVMNRTGEVLGGLFFGHAECGVFEERHEHILTSIAAQGAIAIDNARLYDRVHELLESEREAREAAEHANRAKDEFLAVLGHELRNPLAPIQTALQLMALRGDAQTKERMILERQTGHLIRLVDDLLDVSRITRGKIELEREHVELSSVVAEAIEMASPLIEQKRHHLTVTVPRTGLIVDVDPGRMAQVISNLLTNAAKYTPADGEIHVVAKRDGEEVCVQVTDNGIGIAAESIARVFDPFVQEQQALDRARGGLGLGLTIVRNFVKLHGGTVTAASDGLNAGSTFTVRLAAVATTNATDELCAAQPLRAPRANARRVLVVDDNVDAAELIVATLESLGHQAQAAFDGPSALLLAGRLQPNVALLDIGLPVMDGYELARRLRELPELRNTRLIALTGYGTDDDRARSLKAGFDEHLVKPLGIERLEEVLDALPS